MQPTRNPNFTPAFLLIKWKLGTWFSSASTKCLLHNFIYGLRHLGSTATERHRSVFLPPPNVSTGPVSPRSAPQSGSASSIRYWCHSKGTSSQGRHYCFFWQWPCLHHCISLQPKFLVCCFVFFCNKNEPIEITCPILIVGKLAAPLLAAQSRKVDYFFNGQFAEPDVEA